MSMVFPYRQYPVPYLGGLLVRPKPVLQVGLIGPKKSRVHDALLDTGADDTVFPESVAVQIGLDLTNAPSGELSGIGAAPVIVRYAQVHLRVTDGHEFREWPAWVGFTASRLRQPLLGFA